MVDTVYAAGGHGDGLTPCEFVYTIVSYVSREAKFDWDEANIRHITRHGVTPQEVEEAFANDPLVVLATQKRSREERVLCAGLAGAGRPLQFVYTFRRGRIRVITAHTAKRKVRERL
jgi:uncharacterized DUF497 family protein